MTSRLMSTPVDKTELAKLARELHTIHGLLPVPVAGKVPLGGTGWNRQSLEVRIRNIMTPECTGLGIQMGLVFHPVLGPVEARCLDADIDDQVQRNTFAAMLRTFFQPTHWRWGRRPATIIFTQPGVIKQEKFGPVQLLGANKQVVYWGEYRNKLPLPTDPPEYWHEGSSIFDVQPPFIPGENLKTWVEISLGCAGIRLYKKPMLSEAVPLTAADLAMLTPDTIARFRDDIKSMLIDVDNSPTGSGRGNKLFMLGLKYGALIKASGSAPMLADAMYEVCSVILDYEVVDNPMLVEIGHIADQAFAMLPGSLGQGDRRDFARGVGTSIGLSQHVEVQKAKMPLPMPDDRNFKPGQIGTDLLAENLPPLKFLVNRFFTDSGCIVLAGKPKIGKGWIVLELALSIAEGSQFWGEACTQGEVLMYMLEDSKRRVKERIKILRPLGFKHAHNIRFKYSVDGPFDVNADGTGTLLDNIRTHMRLHPAIRFVVIDVLQRIRGEQNRADNAYQVDYKVVGAIQKLSTEFNVLILVVHHTKKGKVDDAIDSINGSFGVIGAADGGIIIGKEADVVKVESRMRDIPDFEFEMLKEGTSPMWKPAQTAAELFMPSEGTKTREVVTALHTATCCLTAGDIAARTGISEKNVAVYLQRMMKSNQVTRPSRGFYMATGLPYRERIRGVIDLLKRVPRVAATDEVKAQYAPNGVPPEATYMILTPVAIKEIEAGFVNGKDCLNSLKLRNLITYNSDTTWLLGDDWGDSQPVMKSTPFAMRMPWEL